RMAHINANLDSDSMIRKTWLQIKAPDGTPIPSLAMNAVQMAGVDVGKYIENDYVAGRSQTSEIYIDYNATSDEFITVPFIYVLMGEVDPALFKDAIV